MRELNIGTKKHTVVCATDGPEFNANHEYVVSKSKIEDEDSPVITTNFADIKFQKGPIKENGINGCHNEDLIAIVIDRLQSFQKSEWSCRENSVAITKLEESLMWLRKRTQDRENRGVEGTSTI